MSLGERNYLAIKLPLKRRGESKNSFHGFFQIIPATASGKFKGDRYPVNTENCLDTTFVNRINVISDIANNGNYRDLMFFGPITDTDGDFSP